MEARPPNEAEFRVYDVLGSAQAIYLESVHMPGYFVSFDDDGQPGDEKIIRTKERFSQFEIHLVSRDSQEKNSKKIDVLNEHFFFHLLKIAYGPGIQPEKDDRTIETSDEPPPPSYWAATAASNHDSQTGNNSKSS